MKVEKKREGGNLTISLEGRLDTNTYQDLEAVLPPLDDIENLVFDFAKLEYISSAGLRILLSCQKQMHAHGSMVVKHVNEDIREVLDITGFSDIIDIE